MATQPLPLEIESFVVRFWHEPASRAWRGKVIHVPSGAACDFATLEQALGFMRQFVPVLPRAKAADDG